MENNTDPNSLHLAILNNLPIALACVKRDRKVVFLNNTFLQIFQPSKKTDGELCGDLMGCTYHESEKNNDFFCGHCPIKKIIDQGFEGESVRNFLFNKTLKIAGKTALHMLSLSSVILDNERLLLIIEDKTEEGEDALKNLDQLS